ncbi:MAG: serine hydrolase [Alphaproteobacteria bacterium]|nr:serine hydrolase [Alphaproteobacteria bacterium]
MTAGPDRRQVALGLSALLASACSKPRAPAPEAKAPAVARPPPQPSAITDANALKTQLDQLVGDDVPALAAAAVNKMGVTFIGAAGVRRAGETDPVTVDDPWHIGSDTKAMTAALYARLVDKGRAKWGATLPDLFPDLASSMDAAWRQITVEQLMSHRAGLDDIGVPWLIARRADTRSLQAQRLDTARDKLSKPPAKPVGEFSYANVNYIIVGAAIEQITGLSWEKAITAEVFQPLGMEGAGFGAPKGAAPQGHRANPLGGVAPVGTGPGADNPAALGPAGTVHLPLDDWAKFIAVFLDPGQTFLKKESLEHLVTPPAGASYALGWGIIDDPVAGRMLSHAGSNTMWFAQAIIAPEHGIAALAASNCATAAAQKAVETATNSLLLGQLQEIEAR